MKWRKRTALVIAITMSLHCNAFPVAAAESESSETTETQGGLSGKIGDAFGFLSERAGEAAEAVQGAAGTVAEKAGELGVTASEKAGEFGAAVSEQAGKAADAAGTFISNAGATMSGFAGDASETAAQLSEAASKVTKDVKEKAEEVAAQAMSTMSGAADVVVDQSGNIRNLAVEGAGVVADSAVQAYEVIRDKGSELMQIAQEAISKIDVSDPEALYSAKETIDKAVEESVEDGSLGVKLSQETIQIVTDVVFWSAVYGIQYTNKQISLPEYASLMSGVIIRNGLPAGVGFVADRLPIPGVGNLAKTVTTLLIEAAYQNGQEEVLTEENGVNSQTKDAAGN